MEKYNIIDLDKRNAGAELKEHTPEPTPAEQLAIEIDAFTHDYDLYSYRDSVENEDENIFSIAQSLENGDIEYLEDWLKDIITDEEEPVEHIEKASEILEKLTEYKPLVKIVETSKHSPLKSVDGYNVEINRNSPVQGKSR